MVSRSVAGILTMYPDPRYVAGRDNRTQAEFVLTFLELRGCRLRTRTEVNAVMVKTLQKGATRAASPE